MRVIFFILLLLVFLVPPGEISSTVIGQKKDRPPNSRTSRALTLPDDQEKLRYQSIRQEAFNHPFDEAKLKAYLETLPKDGGHYIVEGDLLLTEQEIRAYVVSKSQEPRLISPGPELSVNLHDGNEDYYKDVNKRILTYAVDRSSFPSGKDDWYQVVIRNVRTAAQEWQSVCPNCRIRFVYMSQFDGTPTHDKVNFVVRYHDVGGEYIAATFFPHDGPLKRFFNIDQSYFTTRFDKVGVMRHELGHVLGYRHEHTRDVPGCYYEDKQWLPLTPYDPQSVMHYFCGGGGSLSLAISPTDKIGHRKLYALSR